MLRYSMLYATEHESADDLVTPVGDGQEAPRPTIVRRDVEFIPLCFEFGCIPWEQSSPVEKSWSLSG